MSRENKMVSAVFHSPMDHSINLINTEIAEIKIIKTKPKNNKIKSRDFKINILAPLLGFIIVVLMWFLLTIKGSSFPSPWFVFQQAVKLFSDPFYNKGPNDIGIGWNILYSLRRVALGFGLAAIVGIPIGILIGRFKFLYQMVSPLIGILRPVSPLAWLPIGLLMFNAANPAAIWTIFICSIWPMVLNTAAGIRQIPDDYINVARVLNLSELKVMTKIIIPSILPHILIGIRLSLGTAWLVIVAAEMLTGGVGIGFWLWDEWNNQNATANILIAIFVIGIVGLILESALIAIAKKFSHENA
jgi:nitrate/nitrite transport system permease protein